MRYGLSKVQKQLCTQKAVTSQMNLDRNMRRQTMLAAELVNVMLPGQAGGRDYEPSHDATDRFLALLTSTKRKQLQTVDDHTVRLARLAKALRSAFDSDEEAKAVDVLNKLMRRYKARPFLTRDAGQPFHLHFHGDAETAVESLGGEFATTLALLMDTYGMRRFGICEASNCDRVYVDLTRNGSRRYCGDACTARAKTAAYRRRHAEDN